MKFGKITYYIEIPITVQYTVYPSEPMTPTYPGCEAELTIDSFAIPREDDIIKIIDKENDQIKMACWEDIE